VCADATGTRARVEPQPISPCAALHRSSSGGARPPPVLFAALRRCLHAELDADPTVLAVDLSLVLSCHGEGVDVLRAARGSARLAGVGIHLVHLGSPMAHGLAVRRRSGPALTVRPAPVCSVPVRRRPPTAEQDGTAVAVPATAMPSPHRRTSVREPLRPAGAEPGQQGGHRVLREGARQVRAPSLLGAGP